MDKVLKIVAMWAAVSFGGMSQASAWEVVIAPPEVASGRATVAFVDPAPVAAAPSTHYTSVGSKAVGRGKKAERNRCEKGAFGN